MLNRRTFMKSAGICVVGLYGLNISNVNKDYVDTLFSNRLDHFADMYGMMRMKDETDEKFRERLKGYLNV